jgi:poly [ADP-ribose] polymerase
VAGKYDMLEMDYEAKDECDEGDGDGDSDDVVKDKPASKLDVKVQKLIEMICDVKSMEETIKEMKYDTKKAPLGKLTTAQIKSGFSALKKIESLVQAGNTRGDAIYKACDEFYTRIPHNFGMKRPPLITTKQEIKEKLALLEALSDIQVAMTILQKKVEDDDVHPIDRHYKEMDCEICPLSSDDEMYDLIGKYIKQTHGSTHSNYTLEVKEIFEINKQKEIARFKDVGNRQLLWHGSRITNWMGILSQGLRIAPPEAPVTGYMFGKGLYFADSSSKSANYCFATPNKPEGLLLLNEVSLGGTNDLAAADHNAHKLPKGTNSTKGVGQFAPDPAQNHTL